MKKYSFLSVFVSLILFLNISTAEATQSAKVEYVVPIDYSYLNEESINASANKFYKEYLETKSETALQNMLTTYTLLTNINKDNPLYFVRVGIAYDKMKKDKYAKSYFCRSMNIVSHYAYPYAAFGDFWFDRNQYRKALKNYLIANEYGYYSDYENLYKIGTCFEKLGDYKSAIQYFKMALNYKNTEDLINKINSLEALLEANPLYDERERRTY